MQWLKINTNYYERNCIFTEINKKISTFTWFQEVRRDVVKYMLRMNDILITAKYESLPGRG